MMAGEWKDNPEVAARAGEISQTHGIYAIRGDQEAWSEKLARFKASEGREEVRAEMGALLFDMMGAWKAHLAEINQRDGAASMLNAKVNRVMGGYLNLLFRVVDSWPTSSDGAHALELERIERVLSESKEDGSSS